MLTYSMFIGTKPNFECTRWWWCTAVCTTDGLPLQYKLLLLLNFFPSYVTAKTTYQQIAVVQMYGAQIIQINIKWCNKLAYKEWHTMQNLNSEEELAINAVYKTAPTCTPTNHIMKIIVNPLKAYFVHFASTG